MTKTVWSCSECGTQTAKWVGQCNKCSSWNCVHKEESFEVRYEKEASKAVRLKDVSTQETPRIATKIGELDRLLSGGIVRGSLTLVGGDPGIGKSTLLLQTSEALGKQGLVILYVCGEESVAQTSLRAKRLGISSDNILFLCETNLSVIKQQIDEVSPDLLIIDSIQIVYKDAISSAPGSVSQVRECATEFMHLAKGRNIATFLIGHVTKSGEIAGPRILEHLVDTVLYFEGEKQHYYRILRAIKNRFGSVDEVAVFQMGSAGLSEVPNPSQVFLEERVVGNTGSVIVPTIEGSRPILIELQALVTDAVYSAPSRRCTGFDSNRLALLLAILEKRVGYQFHKRDVLLSIAGGMKIVEPAMDLPAVIAMSSSLTNRPVDPKTVVVGEVGLGGEVRTVSRIETRVKEAINLGFSRVILPARNVKGLGKKIEIIGVNHVEEAISLCCS
ncbi:MAG: DNA repair protein RadA [Chlamydiales bacterium]|nr:DNA repair protein RadA [Chlamydiales bacterium]MCH9619957.1 DNA repair protein RadA [Chlamydiales bacterium]MCH9622616.1 DNA repair protein RadA [Chlamydiales bacterium]